MKGLLEEIREHRDDTQFGAEYCDVTGAQISHISKPVPVILAHSLFSIGTFTSFSICATWYRTAAAITTYAIYATFGLIKPLATIAYIQPSPVKSPLIHKSHPAILTSKKANSSAIQDFSKKIFCKNGGNSPP